MNRILATLILAGGLTLSATGCHPCTIRPGSDYRNHVWYDRQGHAYAVSESEDSPLHCK